MRRMKPETEKRIFKFFLRCRKRTAKFFNFIFCIERRSSCCFLVSVRANEISYRCCGFVVKLWWCEKRSSQHHARLLRTLFHTSQEVT